MELEPYFYYFMMTKTPYLPSVKYEWALLNYYSHIKYTIESMGQWYPYSKKLEENIVIILHIYGAIAIFLLFYDDKDTLSTEYEI